MALPCLAQTTLVSGVGGQLPGCRFFLVERRDDWGSHTRSGGTGFKWVSGNRGFFGPTPKLKK